MYSHDYFGFIKTLLLSSGVFAMVTLSGLNEWLKFLSIMVAIGYGVWKWRTDYVLNKKNNSTRKKQS